VLGVGFDIVDMVGFSEQLADGASTFVEVVFTDAERGAAPEGQERRLRYFAGRFAVKEAFVKAWSSARLGRAPVLGAVALREIEILDDGFGRPLLRLHGTARTAVADTLPPYRVHLSISHGGGYAGAVVVLEADTIG